MNQGQLFKKAVRVSDFSVSDIAKKLSISRDMVYNLFKKEKLNEYYIEKLKANGIDLTANAMEPESQVKHGVPIYEVGSRIELVEIITKHKTDKIIGYIDTPQMRDSQLGIRINNDSKTSEFKRGSWIILREIKDKSVIEFDAPYLIITDEWMLIKYISEGNHKNHWVLKSNNNSNRGMEIPIDKIKHLLVITNCVAVNSYTLA